MWGAVERACGGLFDHHHTVVNQTVANPTYRAFWSDFVFLHGTVLEVRAGACADQLARALERAAGGNTVDRSKPANTSTHATSSPPNDNPPRHLHLRVARALLVCVGVLGNPAHDADDEYNRDRYTTKRVWQHCHLRPAPLVISPRTHTV